MENFIKYFEIIKINNKQIIFLLLKNEKIKNLEYIKNKRNKLYIKIKKKKEIEISKEILEKEFQKDKIYIIEKAEYIKYLKKEKQIEDITLLTIERENNET